MLAREFRGPDIRFYKPLLFPYSYKPERTGKINPSFQ